DGYGYNDGAGSYRDYVRQLRACRQHDRLHRELGAEHSQEHAEGLESRGDHRDLHDALEEGHDAYHADHPRADICDAMGWSNRNSGSAYRNYGNPYPYRYAPNGYSYGPSGYYGNGLSFSFGFGR